MKTRLTPFARLLIALTIVLAVFFGGRYLLEKYNIQIPGLPDNGNTSITTDSTSNVVENEPTEEASSEVSNATAKFNYTPPVPANGVLKGVVELGASGFNSFIVTLDNTKNWNLEKAEWGNSLVYDGLSSGKDVKAGLKEYIAKMLDYGVRGKDIHFVVSSGAQKVATTQTIINGLKDLGYVVNPVSPQQEATYALYSVLPKSFENNGFVVDIGSGNTKISWVDNGQVKTLETYGAKYYVDNKSKATVYQEVREVANKIPKHKTATCFIIGGVPYDLSKMAQSEDRYVVLKEPEAYKAEGEKMEAGLNIYQAIADVTGCRKFVFDNKANFTIGFLLSL